MLYVGLALLAAIPVLAFAIGPFTRDSLDLKGPGGPLLAFSAGLLSFVSPCVLPLVPVYLTHLSGATFEGGRVQARRSKTLTHSLVFVGSFSLIFILLGASVGLLGSYFIKDNQRTFEQGAGVMLVGLGLMLVPPYGRRSPMRSALVLIAVTWAFFTVAEIANLRGDRPRLLILAGLMALVWLRFAGYVQLAFFQRTFQLDLARERKVGYTRSALVGAGFAIGWTPCIGPVLGTILTLAGQSSDALTGFYLLCFYSLGLSLPFVLTGLALADAQPVLRKIQRFGPYIEVASAVMIVGLGVLLWTGRLATLSSYFGFADFNQGL
jgi:cytochrome c-type biogenesis protein